VRIQWLHDAALRLGLISAVVLTLASCGAVTGSQPVVVTADLQVLPATADLFPELPTQFSISGGKPGYTVFSSNSLVLPLDSSVTGATFFAIPRNVAVDTPVTITVRDADGKTKDVAVSVKPAVINNNFIFTIVTPAGSGCGANALCGGGTAQVLVTASLNGTILINRPIRFAVFQGDFLFVTPGTGVLVNAITINTDERGEALVRLTATVGAPPQVATLTSTDVTSGLVRRFNFNIVPPTLSALPSANVTFEGAKGALGSTEGFCPVGGKVDFYVFGGAPPYTVASLLPDLVSVSSNLVSSSGGRTTATINGCGQTPLVVTDSTLKAIETALIIGVKGPAGDALPSVPVPPAPTAPPPFVVTPTSLTVPCGGSGTVNAAGGTGSVSTTIVTGRVILSVVSTTGETTIALVVSEDVAVYGDAPPVIVDVAV